MSDDVKISRRELEWLLHCSDPQMGDGDTARRLAEKWLKGESGIEIINERQRKIGKPGI